MPPKDYYESEWGRRIEEVRRADRAKRDAENAAILREFVERMERRQRENVTPAPNTTTCPVCSGHGHITTTTDAPDHA